MALDYDDESAVQLGFDLNFVLLYYYLGSNL